MSKDSIRTRVVTFDTAKHYIILIETLFKDLPFMFTRQQKLWNDAQLKIATVTRFFATLLQTKLLSNFVVFIEHMLSLKFCLN